MDWKIELVAIPVTDVDRAKAFYVDQVGFRDDVDITVREGLRFVQLTPPGSACSVVLGEGVTEMAPGSQKGVQMVVADVAAAPERPPAPGGAARESAAPPGGACVPVAAPHGQPARPARRPPHGGPRT